MGALIILSPTVMPWYLRWVLPFAVLARQPIWSYFSTLILTAFHIMIDQNEYALALWFEYGLFCAMILIWLCRRKITKITAGIRLDSKKTPVRALNLTRNKLRENF